MGIPMDDTYAELSTYTEIENPIRTIDDPINATRINVNGVDYKLLDYYSNASNGYAGFAYQNTETGGIVVVHGGSHNLFNPIDNLSDWFNDWVKTDGQVGLDTVPSQFLSADYFLSKVIAENTGVNVEQTGQSLGAGLGQLLGMLEKYQDVQSYCYNPPGCLHFVNNLQNLGYTVSDNFSNITNLISKAEPLSTLYEQAGNNYVATNGALFNHFVDAHINTNLNYELVNQPVNLESLLSGDYHFSISQDENVFKLGISYDHNLSGVQLRELINLLNTNNLMENSMYVDSISTPAITYNFNSDNSLSIAPSTLNGLSRRELAQIASSLLFSSTNNNFNRINVENGINDYFITKDMHGTLLYESATVNGQLLTPEVYEIMQGALTGGAANLNYKMNFFGLSSFDPLRGFFNIANSVINGLGSLFDHIMNFFNPIGAFYEGGTLCWKV